MTMPLVGRALASRAAPPHRDAALASPSIGDAAPPPAVEALGRSAGRGVALVVAFWWLATGVLIALERDTGTRLLALALVAICAPTGLLLVARAGRRTTPGGAVESFLGGSLLWTAAAGALYGGWIVGVVDTGPAPGTIALTVQAMLATWYNDAFTLLLGVAAWWLVRHGPNRVGVTTLLVFWLVHAIAKVNVFVGVANPGAHYLPDYLWHLQRYFGPERNSLLLPATVVALVAATLALAWRARRAADAWRRTEAALLATILALSVLETGVLGVAFDAGAWDVFLRLRGGP